MHSGWYDRRTRRIRDLSSGDTRVYLEIEVRRVQCRVCGKVKREQLDFLADNPFYTKRFSHYVGRRCRQGTIKDIALELQLDWDTVKSLELQYMRAQLAAEAVLPPAVTRTTYTPTGHADVSRGTARSPAASGPAYTMATSRPSASNTETRTTCAPATVSAISA